MTQQAFLRQVSATSTPLIAFPLPNTQEVKIGREAGCQILLDSSVYTGVSRYHAAVRPLATAGTWELCDLGSSNGTYVNGQRLEGCQRLHAGDRIVLGQQAIEFVFEITGVSEPEPASVAPNQPAVRSLSLTQLVPILSTGRDLPKKGFLVPAIATAISVALMFTTIGNFSLFATLLAFYLAGAAFYLVYRLCGKRKPWWILLLAAGMTVGLIFAPTFPWMLWFFRRFLPGDVFALSGRANVSFFTYLSTNFFGAGMLEELLKALPVFILTGIGLLFRDRWRDRIGVVEPLDGILIGAASAIGFTLTETLLQYVPETVQEVASQAGEGAGYFVGLQLLIPRILGSVSGHVAYSGYFGYFIGLCALQPKRWWLILPIGYLSSSGLHALWNASASVVNNRFVGAAILAVVGIFAYAFLAAAILKAREVSPTRSQNFSTHIKP